MLVGFMSTNQSNTNSETRDRHGLNTLEWRTITTGEKTHQGEEGKLTQGHKRQKTRTNQHRNI